MSDTDPIESSLARSVAASSATCTSRSVASIRARDPGAHRRRQRRDQLLIEVAGATPRALPTGSGARHWHRPRRRRGDRVGSSR